jgi:multicomponent Na+:H+ antiporter subunit F
MMFEATLADGSFTVWAASISVGLCGLSLALTFVRLLRGPTLADRVVALDLITMVLVLLLTLFALVVHDGAYLDAAIALALVGFLATVAFARYIDRANAKIGVADETGAPTGNAPGAAGEPR